MTIEISPQDTLIVVDMQNDFMPGGALPVAGGDSIVPLINHLLACFPARVLTRDWHPANHLSFSANPTFTDKSWPAHCVQDTPGAAFHPDLNVAVADKVVSKGTDPAQEAYSGFHGTDLEAWLRDRKVQRVFVTGLAADFCVKSTALDAQQAGFETYLITDATLGINDPPGSVDAEIQLMRNSGIHMIHRSDLDCP